MPTWDYDRLCAAILRAPLVPEDQIEQLANRGVVGLVRDNRRTLTPAQLSVVRCLSVGAGYSEASVILGWTYESVKNHALNARRRLGAKTNAHLVAIALRHGLLD